MAIVDLTVSVENGSPSPPIVDFDLVMSTAFMTPGHWQASKVEMLLHTGSHADFTLHHEAAGEEAGSVPLDRVIGDALVVDLTPISACHEITPQNLEDRAPEIVPGDIVLVRTGWTDAMWGTFPQYYADSPVCSPAAAHWLADKQPKAVGFDCFAEESAKSPDFSPEDFDVHRIIGESKAVLLQQLTNLGKVPGVGRFPFFAPFMKINGGEGSPARFFAIIEE